jgi:hypothetical protein
LPALERTLETSEFSCFRLDETVVVICRRGVSGELALSYALLYSYIALTVGSFLSTVVPLTDLTAPTLVFVVTFTLLFVLSLIPSTVAGPPAGFIIALAVLIRFLDGFTSPLIFKIIGESYDTERVRDEVTSIVAVSQTVVAFFGNDRAEPLRQRAHHAARLQAHGSPLASWCLA